MSKLLYILRDKLALWALVIVHNTAWDDSNKLSLHMLFSFVGDLCRVQDKSIDVVAANLSYLYNK